MLFRGDVGSGDEGSRVYLEVCNIALILACSRTSVCIGFVVGPSTITHVKANFGGFLCECGLERYVTLLITFVLFWGCVCDVVQVVLQNNPHPI